MNSQTARSAPPNGASHPSSALESDLARLHEERKATSAQIGRAKASGADASELIARCKELSDQIKDLEANLQAPQEAAEESDRERPQDWSVEFATETAQFEALRQDWRELIARAAPAPPFMQWEWLFPWWQQFGHNKRLRIVTLRDRAGGVIAIAPMMVGMVQKRLEPRTLAFLGSGVEGPRGQGFRVLARAGDEAPAFSRTWQALDAGDDDWELLRMWKVHDDCVTWESVAEATRIAGAGVLVEPAERAVCGPLLGDYEQFLASVPSKVERNLLRNQHDKLGGKYQSVESGICASAQEQRDVVEQIMAFSRVRQRHLGKVSAWENPQDRECLIQATEHLLGVGQARIAYLKLDKKLVAGIVAMVSGKTLYVFAPSFDMAFGRDNVMHALYSGLFRQAAAEGLERLDWLSDHAYQRKITQGERHLLSIDVYRRPGAGFERAARRLWWRSLRRRVKAALQSRGASRTSTDG